MGQRDAQNEEKAFEPNKPLAGGICADKADDLR